jgi:outer membrane protein OmpA-like peptidoglycan-associated protein
MNERSENKTYTFAGTATAALLLAATMALPAMAQNSNTPQTNAQVQTGTGDTMNPADNSSYATGAPLQSKSKEGFWGHVNPFARKKWVNRQLDPVKGRLNELDQLQAKNANDIHALDVKTAAGIHQAQTTADQADQTATTASATAGQAQQTAQQATAETSHLNTTVAGLDQYQKVSDTELRFRRGQTLLNARAKDALTQIAAQVQSQKGYVIEVSGYSYLHGQAGIQHSQHMADAVVRFLVEHQVPVYKIHQIALGNAKPDDGSPAVGNAVRVSVMQNSLAATGTTGAGTAPAAGTAPSSSNAGVVQ